MPGVDIHPLLVQGLGRHESDVHQVITRVADRGGGTFAEIAARYHDRIAASWWADFWLPLLEGMLGHAHGPWLCTVDDTEASIVTFRMMMDSWEAAREATG